jgi:hypothetical protein
MWSTHSRRIDPINRSTKPFCHRLVPDTHGTQSACDDCAVNVIPVPDHVARSLVPGECLRYLKRDPFGGRMCRDVDPDEVSSVSPNDNECIKEVETDRRDNKQVHGGNIWRMIPQEGSPSLTGGTRRLTTYLATLDCATSNPSLSRSPWMRAPPLGFKLQLRPEGEVRTARTNQSSPIIQPA